MAKQTQAGRPLRATAVLLAALALFTTGCAAEPTFPGENLGSAASRVEDGTLNSGDLDGADELEDLEADASKQPSLRPDASPDGQTPADPSGSPAPIDDAAATGTALALLDTLAVKGRASKTGYDRKAKFGSPWADVDHNGCDTRNDILQRDLTNLTLSGRCKVMSGTLADRYTGQTIDFVRGNDTSALVQIDHIVALSDAWQKGAQQLTPEQRLSLANDPINLFASQGAANSAKSDSDAASWLPKNKSFRCEYVAHQVSVKAAYGLWVTTGEQAAMRNVLAACPTEPAVVSDLSTVVPDPGAASATASNSNGGTTSGNKGSASGSTSATTTPKPVASPPEEPTPAPAPPTPQTPVAPPTEAYYKNCTAAREAGAAPVYAGQPGYGRHLDRDGDGVGCE